MKKSTTIVVGVLVGIVFLGGAMFAQNIENTGPNSTNSVTQNNNTECTSENNNNVDVNSDQTQVRQAQLEIQMAEHLLLEMPATITLALQT